MNWLFIIGFAISSSVDNLGVGISYGIRKIRIGFLSNLLIALICFLLSEAGIFFGQLLTRIIPGTLPVLIGSMLLIVIGIRIAILAAPAQKAAQGERQTDPATGGGATALGDAQEIGWKESIILGFTLAANAVTNGLGAGLLGLSPHAIAITAAIGSFVSVWSGVKIGEKVATVRIGPYTVGQFGTIISGVILVCIALNSLL